jgi:hypothetical protein
MTSLSAEQRAELTIARFPLMRAVGNAAFATTAEHIATHPALRVYGNGADDTARAIIAGHLAELFFFRRDLLALFLSQPRGFSLHHDEASFRAAGGIAGGCYLTAQRCIVLRRARLFEGFAAHSNWPGVAPLLHELGHMLDHIDGRNGRARWRCDGLLPGLRPGDGALYSATARERFLAGRALERQRYALFAHGLARADSPQPLGHPYVFQNNGEFCAGYLEMFLRNPNAFARMNTTLFDAYRLLFGWDPRTAWPHDFEFYIETNNAYYAAKTAI